MLLIYFLDSLPYECLLYPYLHNTEISIIVETGFNLEFCNPASQVNIFPSSSELVTCKIYIQLGKQNGNYQGQFASKKP